MDKARVYCIFFRVPRITFFLLCARPLHHPPPASPSAFGRELKRLVHQAVVTDDLPLALIAAKLLLCEHETAGAGASLPAGLLEEELADLARRWGGPRLPGWWCWASLRGADRAPAPHDASPFHSLFVPSNVPSGCSVVRSRVHRVCACCVSCMWGIDACVVHALAWLALPPPPLRTPPTPALILSDVSQRAVSVAGEPSGLEVGLTLVNLPRDRRAMLNQATLEARDATGGFCTVGLMGAVATKGKWYWELKPRNIRTMQVGRPGVCAADVQLHAARVRRLRSYFLQGCPANTQLPFVFCRGSRAPIRTACAVGSRRGCAALLRPVPCVVRWYWE
jgi:hypothetical protein